MVSTAGREDFVLIYDSSLKSKLCNFHLIKHTILSLDRFVSFLTISSIFIAINCLLLVYFSFMLYGIDINSDMLLSSFLLTFTVYSLDKITNIKEDSLCLQERAGFIGRHKNILTFLTGASYIVTLFLSYMRNHAALFAVLFPLLIGLVYSIKIFDFRLKDITGIKNTVVALSWAVVGTFFPLAVTFNNSILIFIVFYFIFIKLFINTTLFDVRDIEGDSMNGVRTIPVYLGLKNTRKSLLILNSTLIFWLIFLWFRGIFKRFLPVLLLAIIYGYWYILHFCRDDIKIGKSLDLLVDGEWILIVIISLIFTDFLS